MTGHASMNRIYRLVWNELTQGWVPVAETARARGKRSSLSGVLAASLFLAGNTAMAGTPAPSELPSGGQVAAGQSDIGVNGSRMDINQATQQTIINWQTFNIGSQARVNFNQPNSSAIALNRVVSSDPSSIYGQLTANGQVFLLNPNGVLFGSGAHVDVGGMVAGAMSLSDRDFMTGNYRFTRAGSGSVVNQGSLNAAPGGYLALLAPEVRNEGVMTASLGTVALAAGEAVTLGITGDRLVNVQVDPASVDVLVENKHLIQAEGGQVILSASAANRLIEQAVAIGGQPATQLVSENGTARLVNVEGTVKAGNITVDGGGTGITRVAGTLDVSSAAAKGGKAVVTGDKVLIGEGARIDASGVTGGGEIYVGGGWQGKDPAIRQANATIIAPSAVLDASATGNGDGGTVVAWSNIHNADSATRAWGTFLARGGINGGNGGRIETSGHWLDTQGVKGDASASNGAAGLWLFDPYSVTITTANANGSFSSGTWTPSASGSSILNTDINTLLGGGTSVTITTGSAGAEIGDITVSSAITKSTGNTDVTLTLQAANSIVIDQAISNTGGTGKLHVVLDADNDNGTRNGGGIILLNNNISTGGGNISFGTGTTMSLNGVTTKVGGDVYVGGSGALALTTAGGNVTVNGEMIIANTTGLSISTSNGNVTFGGIINSGNSYSGITYSGTWSQALSNAASGTGSGTGDTYLATITSRLENAIASRAVSYNPSWLGARRIVGIGTNSSWRWVAGPEGSQGSGNGLVFFTQNGSDSANGSGGTTATGLYSNWNSGEPNNFNGSNLAQEAESVLQFTGNLGQWNDLTGGPSYVVNTPQTLSYYVKETNLAASPLTINAGTGSVTFTGAVGGNKALASLNVTAATIAINGGAVTTEGLQTYTGNVTLGSSATTLTQTNANTDFTLQASKTITNATSANASLTIKTTGSILMGAGSSISSSAGELSTVLHADSDASGGGFIQLDNGGTISTNGGHLWLGGGSGTTTWNSLTVGDSYATGNATNANGIYLDGATLATAGGNIALYGKSRAGAAAGGNGADAGLNADGIRLSTLHATSINSGTGTLLMDGVAQGTSGVSIGVEFDSHLNGVAHTITSAATSGNAIGITGDASATTSGASYRAGVFVHGDDGNSGNGVGSTTVSATGGGNILVTGTGVGTSQGQEAISINGAINGGAGNITLAGDSLLMNSLSETGGSLAGTGNLTIRQKTNGTTIGIAGGSGTLAMTSALLGLIQNGFSQITLGDANSGAITLGGAATFNDNIALVSNGAISLNAALNASGQTVTLTGGSGASVSGSGNITASSLLLNGSGATYTLNTASANSVGTLAATGASAVNFKNSGSLTVGTVGSVNGVTASGNITLEANGASSDLTLSKAVTTTSGTIVLAAGRNFLNNTTIDTGIVPGSGRYLVYSASPSASTEGMSSYSKHYNQAYSAGSTPSYASSGNWFLYSIAPTLSVGASTQTVTYGTAPPSFTPSYSGFIDGDLSGTSGISGTASFSIGGSTSTSGNYTAGSHDVSYTSGLSSSLGYQFQDDTASTGELTVNQKTLTLTGFTASSKDYDGTTTATISNAGSLSGIVGADSVTIVNAGATFSDKEPGTGKTVTLNGVSLGSSDGGNYSVASTATTTADITGSASTLTPLNSGNLSTATQTTPADTNILPAASTAPAENNLSFSPGSVLAVDGGVKLASANTIVTDAAITDVSTNVQTGAGVASAATGNFLEVKPLAEQTFNRESGIRIQLAPDVFVHSDSKAEIKLHASLPDGSPLPGWLAFDPASRSFTGTPPEGFSGSIEILLIAHDKFNNEASTRFMIKVR